MDEFIKLGHDVCLTLCEANPSEELEEKYQIWKFPISNGTLTLNNFPLIIPDPNPRNKEGRTTADLTDGELELYFSSLKTFLLDTIDDFKPDVVECQHIWAHSIAMNELNLPYFATAHNSDQMGFELDERLKPRLKAAAQNALHLFACSKALKAKMLKLYECDDSHISVTYNGYSKDIFFKTALDRESVLCDLNLEIPKDAFLITFGGKVSKTKGIDILIEANELLPKRENIHFIIIGSGDPSEVLDKPLSHYHMENIHFLGHQPPAVLAKLFNISDLGTLPSRREGFSIAALEALTCGLPLVATPPGMPEGINVGSIVPIGDPKALANAYLSMKALPKKEMDALKALAIKAAAKFCWTEIAKKRLKIYSEDILQRGL